jgi:hypothetical protein
MLLVALAAPLAGCGGGRTRAATHDASRTALYSEPAAAAAAQALLAAVPLPPRTRAVASAPTGAAEVFGRPALGPPLNVDAAKAVDRHAFWISRERPQAVLAFIAAHAPARLDYRVYGGSAGRTEEWSETLAVPLASDLDGPRQVFVAAVLDSPSRYALRIDAVAAWHRRRTAASLVPPSARWLQVRVRAPAFRALNPGERSRPHAIHKTVVTSSLAVVQAAARAVNQLPLAEPGKGIPSCPEMGFERPPVFQLAFRESPSGPALAVVRGASGHKCERNGSATAEITTPALAHGVLLTDHLNGIGPRNGEGLAERLEAAFGHRLGLTPES